MTNLTPCRLLFTLIALLFASIGYGEIEIEVNADNQSLPLGRFVQNPSGLKFVIDVAVDDPGMCLGELSITVDGLDNVTNTTLTHNGIDERRSNDFTQYVRYPGGLLRPGVNSCTESERFELVVQSHQVFDVEISWNSAEHLLVDTRELSELSEELQLFRFASSDIAWVHFSVNQPLDYLTLSAITDIQPSGPPVDSALFLIDETTGELIAENDDASVNDRNPQLSFAVPGVTVPNLRVPVSDPILPEGNYTLIIAPRGTDYDGKRLGGRLLRAGETVGVVLIVDLPDICGPNLSFEFPPGECGPVPGWTLNPGFGSPAGGLDTNADVASDGERWLFLQLPGFSGPATSVAHSDAVGTASVGTYILRVAAGHKPNGFTTDGVYLIELLAGDTVIASESLEDPHAAIPNAQWTDIVARAELRGDHSALGQELSIRLSVSDGSGESPHFQGQFDDVRLEYIPPSLRIAQANTWHLLNIPVETPVEARMADLVVADPGDAAPDWTAWKYEGNVESPGYRPLSPQDLIPLPGTGFWFISSEPVTLVIPEGSTPNALNNCSAPGQTNCYSQRVAGAASWNLVGNSIDSTIHYDGFDVTDMPVTNSFKASSSFWQYDQLKGAYVRFGLQGVKIARPWQGYWFRADAGPTNAYIHYQPYSVPIPQMVPIPAPAGGIYTIGSLPGEPGRGPDENQTQVQITSPFRMASHEVTFAQYDAFVDATNSRRPRDSEWGREDRPVSDVSWFEANEYAAWLSAQTGYRFRLPTEAEWEYAARAGTTTAYFTGDTISSEQANFNGTLSQPRGVYRRKTVPVGTIGSSNSFGLFDVHGNVLEWTCSEYASSYFGREEACASPTSTQGQRVTRGGTFFNFPDRIRSASRVPQRLDGFDNVGFRLVQVEEVEDLSGTQ